MAARLVTLMRDLFDLRRYRARRAEPVPWRLRVPYVRNVVRHQALDDWPGGYIARTDGRLAYVPARVDVMAGYRLLKPFAPIPLLETLCRPGDCALDIGANVGDWTMQMALQVGSRGRVLAFEPVPHLAETIAKTARINRQDWVEVHQLALSDADGTAEFSVEGGNSGGSRLGRMQGDFTQITVETARLDSMLERRPDIDRVDFVKIDVEGNEDRVLAGAQRTLARFRPPLLVESGFETEAQRAAIHDLLAGLEFDIIGAAVPGGLVEASWHDYRCNGPVLADIGLCNLLFMPRAAK